MFVEIENEEEFTHCVKKNVLGMETNGLDIKLIYTVDKKNNMLDCIPIIKDLQNIILDYYSHEVIVRCTFIRHYPISNSTLIILIVFEDGAINFDSTGDITYYGNYKKYEKEINHFKTIIDQLYKKN